MRIARVKLQHDLYDRRFAVFQAARKLLADVLTHARTSDEQIRAYVIGTSDAVFLLDNETSAYLEKIRSAVLRLNAINMTINPLPICKQRSELADEDARITLWLTAQLPDGLVAQFSQFLTLQQKRSARRLRVFRYFVSWRRLRKPHKVT